MGLRLQIIFNEFDDLEKHVLEKSLSKGATFDEKERRIIDYFVNINLLKPKDSGFVFAIPLFANYIKEQSLKKNRLALNELKQISLNGVIIEGFFSVREKKLLRFFLQLPNTSITRAKVASIIWKQQNYTDWALDQFIRRLRNKFAKLGLNRSLISTMRNQGFIFSQEKYGQ